MVESINVKHETVKRTEKHRKQEQIIDKFVHVKWKGTLLLDYFGVQKLFSLL